MKKSLQNLNLIDNFLYSIAMSHEVHGPRIAGILLKTILGREVKIRQIITEKPIFPNDPSRHGIRLDAYIEGGEAEISSGTVREVYDIEPENKRREKDLLPMRARFYHSRIDGQILKAMTPYKELPNTWVIFITSFDPFGENRMVYTIRNCCEESPGMKYEDGARTLFLYVKGERGNSPKELQELLRYIGKTTPENACNPDLKRVQESIDDLKLDTQIKETYMDFEIFLESERRDAAEEAREKAEEAAKQRIEAEMRRADAAERQINEVKQQADEAKRQINEVKQQADEAKRQANLRIQELESQLNALLAQQA